MKMYLDEEAKRGEPQEATDFGDLQDWQIEAFYPEQFAQLQEQREATDVKPGGFMDSNAALDFAGNLVWSLGKSISLGGLDVADIAYKGSMAEAFGSQPWEEESTAGKAGAVAHAVPS